MFDPCFVINGVLYVLSSFAIILTGVGFPGVLLLLVFRGSSSRCRGLVCSV